MNKFYNYLVLTIWFPFTLIRFVFALMFYITNWTYKQIKEMHEVMSETDGSEDVDDVKRDSIECYRLYKDGAWVVENEVFNDVVKLFKSSVLHTNSRSLLLEVIDDEGELIYSSPLLKDRQYEFPESMSRMLKASDSEYYGFWFREI